jgi:EpsD family peptidyl-prolyl cis-trans isomerase
MMTHKPVLAMMLVAAVGAAVSCSRTEDASVAARVNGYALPLTRLPEQPAERAGEATARALDKAIDQELLVQGALDKKLDKDPRISQAIENARRQILAQAYVDRVVAPATASSNKEIREFYQRNPALFAQRRVYRFQEVSVEAPADKLEPLKEHASSAKDVGQLTAWLKEQKVPFNVAVAVRPAEQVPLQYLPRLAEMKDGDIAVLPTPRGASVLQLVHAQEAGLSEAQAAPVIERFLASRRRLQLAEQHVARLREKAKIEYLGDYAFAARAPSSIAGRSASGPVGKGALSDTPPGAAEALR